MSENNDEGVLISMAVWSEKTLELQDLTDTNGIPGVFRITKGQYKDKLPSNVIYVHSIQTGEKVLGEAVKVTGRQMTTTGEKLSIPVSYLGWFEVLSEDGKQIQPMTSVQELAKVFPQYCLVRENFKALTSAESMEDVLVDKMRIVVAGEKLHLVDDTWLDEKSAKGIVKKRFLRCIDEKGANIYLSLEQKAVFSPMAGHNNISGVHNIRGLLEKFRLPITVKLVHGNVPTKAEKTLPMVVRLLGVYADETAFVLPLLKKDSKLTTMSTLETVVLAPARNISTIRKSKPFMTVHRKCKKMISGYMNSVHFLMNALPQQTLTIRPELGHKDRTLPSKSANQSASRATKSSRKDERDEIFDEIDDIYRYVRVGGPPPTSGTNRTHVTDPYFEDPYDEFQWMEQTADLPEEEENDEDKYPAKSIKPEDKAENWDEPIYEDIAKKEKSTDWTLR